MPKPKLTLAEKLERKERLAQKREARRLAKEKKEREKAEHEADDAETSTSGIGGENNKASGSAAIESDNCFIFSISNDADAQNHFLSFLPARDLGALMLTCRKWNNLLVMDDARAFYALSRLSHKSSPRSFETNLCRDIDEARKVVEESYGGGDTGRLKLKGKAGKWKSEFVNYARFLQEAVNGYSDLSVGGRTPTMLPTFVNGRFASTSPEHTLCRVGGGGNVGSGGSGVASSGVGKRGQLGNGKRDDERKLKMVIGGLGYKVRIVQVAAGGGLVRVAHSLLLTSTGRVLSFGTGQYGALGHGYSGGKQLPDILRPKYIDALSGTRCVCIAAGELHSAAVTVDGDLYTWGDGFCGQLGHGDKGPCVTPTQVTKGGLEDECVANVALGARHSLAVTDDGEVFSFGLGHFGVLGRSFTPYDHEPVGALDGMGDGQLEDFGFVGEQHPPPAVNANANEDRDGQAGNAYNFDDVMAHLDLITNIKLQDSSDQCIPKVIDSLEGVKIVGASAGHRHSLFLDDQGYLYSCGAGKTGCLGHGDRQSLMVPMRIKYFDDTEVKITQMSAGVDISMACDSRGDVYAWGKTDGGRIGLGTSHALVNLPSKLEILSDGLPMKAIDVECGYVHSVIVGLNGTIYTCGKVGIDGNADGLNGAGEPVQEDDFNIWHRVTEPTERVVKAERWKKLNKYEIKGRKKNMSEEN
jgi:E3 ubiquitin-protein ligase HERC2